jgi:hypothetical protein
LADDFGCAFMDVASAAAVEDAIRGVGDCAEFVECSIVTEELDSFRFRWLRRFGRCTSPRVHRTGLVNQMFKGFLTEEPVASTIVNDLTALTDSSLSKSCLPI